MALLSAFNPHEYTPAQLNALATARETELARALDTIRSNLRAETMQHLIISAPRGYGKSFLMRHIQVEAQRIAETEKLPLAVVLMPEEMPHVKEPETLIQEIIRALTGGGGETAQLRWHEDDGEAWDAAILGLQAAITDKLGKDGLLVALVENFDQLLRRAFRQDVHAQRLRNLITLPGGRLMLIAASASGAIDRDYDKALFQAFAEIALEPWSVDDCMRFFDRQREAAGKSPLDEAAHARAKAVANFIGGTPRLATLLGEQLFDEDLLNAADLLRGLVDELTPYYKSRIEALPGRSQLLLDALLRGGEPATQSEIATRVQANSQAAIAAPFNDLKNERAVIGIKAPDSAEVLYRVSDRVFAHYYRRRIIDHGRELCPLEGLVDLLADFYNPEEKQAKALELLRLGHISEARVMARLHDKDLGNSLSGRRQVLLHLSLTIPMRLIPHASSVGKSVLESIAEDVKRGDVDHAYTLVERALLRSPSPEDQTILLLVRSALERFDGLEGGIVALEKAIASARSANNEKLIYEANRFKADSLGELNRPDEALSLQISLLKEAQVNRWHNEEIDISLDIILGYIGVKEYKKALLIGQRILSLSRNRNIKSGEIRSNLIMALVYVFDGSYKLSVEQYSYAVKFVEVNYEDLESEFLEIFGRLLAIATVSFLSSSSEVFYNVHSILKYMQEIIEENECKSSKYYDVWLSSFIDAAIRIIKDPDKLTQWADAVQLYFANRLVTEIERMRTTAEYHRSGRSVHVLARMEPDFASTLRAMFPPADPSPEASPKAKRGGGRRKISA